MSFLSIDQFLSFSDKICLCALDDRNNFAEMIVNSLIQSLNSIIFYFICSRG